MAFVTTGGRPVPAVTADEMREVDRAAGETGVELFMMMENAGRNLAAHARELRGDGPVVVLAGSGGNGGGGLCAARHLHNRDLPVEVVLDRDPGGLSGAAAAQFGILDAMGLSPAGAVPDAGVVVDALVGYGLQDALRGRPRELVAACADARVLSLDVPSGVDATTGEAPGVAVDPARTLTLALPKTGLADAATGDLYLADIAIPAAVYERAGVDYAVPFGDEYWVELRPA